MQIVKKAPVNMRHACGGARKFLPLSSIEDGQGVIRDGRRLLEPKAGLEVDVIFMLMLLLLLLLFKCPL